MVILSHKCMVLVVKTFSLLPALICPWWCVRLPLVYLYSQFNRVYLILSPELSYLPCIALPATQSTATPSMTGCTYMCLSVCLSVGLSSRIAKLIHYRVVVFPMPRTSAWLIPRLCPLLFIVLLLPSNGGSGPPPLSSLFPPFPPPRFSRVPCPLQFARSHSFSFSSSPSVSFSPPPPPPQQHLIPCPPSGGLLRRSPPVDPDQKKCPLLARR